MGGGQDLLVFSKLPLSPLCVAENMNLVDFLKSFLTPYKLSDPCGRLDLNLIISISMFITFNSTNNY